MRYSYRVILAFPIFICVVSLLIPFVAQQYATFSNIYYYIYLASVFIIPIVWSKSKFIIISDNLIQFGILWSVIYQEVSICDMEEASEIASRKSLSALESRSAMHWIGRTYYAPTLKIIIKNSEALYLNTSNIIKGNEVFDLIKEKVKFVRT